MKGKAAVVNILKQEGTEFMFCFPHNHLIDAAACVGIRPIMTRTERTLVNMADGYTRVLNGRRTGVCAVQHGPGAENAFAGVAQAFSDSIPILMLPGQFARHRLGVHPHFDGVQSYAGITKWTAQINYADRVPELLRRAFTLLRNGKPGPVVLEIPIDVMDEEFDNSELDYSPVRRAKTLADPEDVKEAVRALLSTKNPVLHVGQGVLWAEACDELIRFAELVGAPVMTTLAGKSAFPENHPLSSGMVANTRTKPAAHFLQKADLVFGIGCSFSKAPLTAPIPPGKVMVQVTINELDINKDYPIDHAVVGDAKLVLGQLIAEVKNQAGERGKGGNGAVVQEIKAIKDEWLEEWMPRLTSSEVPINPYRVIWDLMHTIDRKNTIVTHDSGNPRDQMAPFFEAIAPRGYLGWGKSTQLGYGLGLAMGAKLAAPDKMVVNFMGDAAFGMAGMDFETAVREKIPILTIIVNNSAMGGYETYLPNATERYGTKFLSGNYTKVVEGLGGYSERVEQPDDIIPAIHRAKKATESGRPALLEVITKEDPVFSKYED